MGTTIVYDFVGAEIGKVTVPGGIVVAGYITGSNGVQWPDTAWAKYPSAIRIDQSPVLNAVDETADVADVENGAMTIAECPTWAKAAMANYRNAVRPGQRSPLIYASASVITDVVNALVGAGVTSGIGLWVANWNLSDPQAVADVNSASGPFPIHGVQFHNDGAFDISVFSTEWLSEVSKVTTPPTPTPAPTPPPFQGEPNPGMQFNWHHCRKCQTLFYWPNRAVSVCAAGGMHDGSQSHDYLVVFIN